jgi:hypothetical protein
MAKLTATGPLGTRVMTNFLSLPHAFGFGDLGGVSFKNKAGGGELYRGKKSAPDTFFVNGAYA